MSMNEKNPKNEENPEEIGKTPKKKRENVEKSRKFLILQMKNEQNMKLVAIETKKKME